MCRTCKGYLYLWFKRKNNSFRFFIPTVWHELQNLTTDCYCCAVDIRDFNTKHKKNSLPKPWFRYSSSASFVRNTSSTHLHSRAHKLIDQRYLTVLFPYIWFERWILQVCRIGTHPIKSCFVIMQVYEFRVTSNVKPTGFYILYVEGPEFNSFSHSDL